jgi:hypothetical protein
MSDLMTFIGGAAVGTLVTYLAKNEEARKTTERFIDGLGTSFTDFLHRITPQRTVQSKGAGVEADSEAKPEPTMQGGKADKKRTPAGTGKSVH